jgi:hypothetical protein
MSTVQDQTIKGSSIVRSPAAITACGYDQSIKSNSVMRSLALLLGCAAVAGCVSAPQTYEFEKTRVYQKPYDQAWTDLIEFFSGSNIQIKTIEKDSGIIYAESTSFDPSFADCGSAPGDQVVANNAQFNVFVRRLDEQLTQVTVNSDFRQVRGGGFGFYYSSYVVTCNSTGRLEQAVLAGPLR